MAAADDAALVARVTAERAAQGLPTPCEDPVALAELERMTRRTPEVLNEAADEAERVGERAS